MTTIAPHTAYFQTPTRPRQTRRATPTVQFGLNLAPLEKAGTLLFKKARASKVGERWERTGRWKTVLRISLPALLLGTAGAYTVNPFTQSPSQQVDSSQPKTELTSVISPGLEKTRKAELEKIIQRYQTSEVQLSEKSVREGLDAGLFLEIWSDDPNATAATGILIDHNLVSMPLTPELRQEIEAKDVTIRNTPGIGGLHLDGWAGLSMNLVIGLLFSALVTSLSLKILTELNERKLKKEGTGLSEKEIISTRQAINRLGYRLVALELGINPAWGTSPDGMAIKTVEKELESLTLIDGIRDLNISEIGQAPIALLGGYYSEAAFCQDSPTLSSAGGYQRAIALVKHLVDTVGYNPLTKEFIPPGQSEDKRIEIQQEILRHAQQRSKEILAKYTNPNGEPTEQMLGLIEAVKAFDDLSHDDFSQLVAGKTTVERIREKRENLLESAPRRFKESLGN